MHAQSETFHAKKLKRNGNNSTEKNTHTKKTKQTLKRNDDIILKKLK